MLALGGKGHGQVALGAGDADVGQAAFFLDRIGFDAGAVREDFLLKAEDIHRRKFQALGGVQRHHLHAIGAFFLFLLAFEHVAQHQLADGVLDGHGAVFVFLQGVLQRLNQEPDVAHPRVGNFVVGGVLSQPIFIVDVHHHAAQRGDWVILSTLLAYAVHPALEAL